MRSAWEHSRGNQLIGRREGKVNRTEVVLIELLNEANGATNSYGKNILLTRCWMTSVCLILILFYRMRCESDFARVRDHPVGFWIWSHFTCSISTPRGWRNFLFIKREQNGTNATEAGDRGNINDFMTCLSFLLLSVSGVIQ
jgi:hypothetical protein